MQKLADAPDRKKGDDCAKKGNPLGKERDPSSFICDQGSDNT